MRVLAAVAALLVVTACGGSDPEPAATGSPSTAKPTASATTAKPKPKPKPAKTPSRTPTPTTPPPATGDPVGTEGALLRLAEGGQPRGGNDCGAIVPDMTTPECTALKTSGGTLIAATGRLNSRKALRLLVQTSNGYVPRYEGVDPSRSWRSTRVYATPLTGQGTDGIVFAVRLTDGALTYDVLTWVKGGPLVLRAHRPAIADGRLAPKDGALEEYELATDGSFVKRRLAWDGRRFRLSAGTRSTSPPPK